MLAMLLDNAIDLIVSHVRALCFPDRHGRHD
jgi:hypothetical protein